jgi:hypothetical protein
VGRFKIPIRWEVKKMSYKKNLQVPYHQQDTDYYCGAACAQMVLASPKANLGLLNQDDLYIENHNNSLNESNLHDAYGNPIIWATAPDGLRHTLYDKASWLYFVQDAMTTEDAISHMIAWTIQYYEVAPCALVMGAQHWIVVRGMDVSTAPTNWDDSSYVINSFRVNDPWPPVPSWNMTTRSRDANLAPPPPHGAADNCGSGGNRGTADQMISYSQWRNTYMTGANYHPQGHWQGLFVAICDPDPPPPRRGISARREVRFDGSRLIEREEAMLLAKEMIEKRKLPEDENWIAAFRDANATDTITVQRLDRLDEYYTIVPMMSNKARGASAALSFDARFGDFQQAIVFPKPEVILANPPTSEAVLKQVVGKTIELEKHRGPLRLRKGAVNVFQHWVWKPCMESLSPFWPFRMLTSGGHTVYVRIDGQVFPTLHENFLGL